MTSKQLTVHNASVTTMTVEVKALTIGSRQVTKGIFSQLIEEPLIAEDGTLNGVPWGRVTWHPDKCETSRVEHMHIVWQSGNDLRRSRVDTIPDFVLREDMREYSDDATDNFATALIREACHHRADRTVLTWTGRLREYNERTLNEPVNKETKVSAYGLITRAALAAVDSDRRVTEALATAQRPLTSFDCGWHAAGWCETHPELADVVKQAIESGVEISLKRNPDNNFDVCIRVRQDTEALGKALRAEEHAILELLLDRRNSSFEALTNAMNKHAEVLAALDAEVEPWGSWPEIQAEYDATIRAEAARRQRHRDIRATLAQLDQLFIGG